MARERGIQEERYLIIKLNEFDLEKEKKALIDDILSAHGDTLLSMFGTNNEDTIMEAVEGAVERAFSKAIEVGLPIKI